MRLRVWTLGQNQQNIILLKELPVAQAKVGDRVKVHYTGKLEDGTTFDSSSGGDPIEFTLGSGEVIDGFDQAVLGMNPGDSKSAVVSPEKGYGPRQEEMVIEVGKDQFPENVDKKVGLRFRVDQEEGPALVFTIAEVKDESVTLDANHPLAGKDLTFDIELMDIVGT